MKNPDAILCSDLHLRDDQPVCRIDNYFEAQSKKIGFISDLQEKYNCPVICAGDIFHKAKSSPFLEAWAIDFMPKIKCIPGQHDLPNHLLDNFNKSSLGVLNSAEKITVLNIPFGRVGVYPQNFLRGKIAITHQLILKPDDEQDKIIGGQSAISLLKKYSVYDLILTGDNHKSFIVEYEGRLLVNPGSMMRMTAGQIDHKPRVYLWNVEENKVEPIYFPIEENVISRKHIEIQEQKDKRIEAFVSRIKDDFEIGLNFEKNLESFFLKNKIRQGIQDVVWEAINE